jgi:hypothetical protein
MKSYGVLVAYLHDIGMIDFRPFGRAMHPEFASQAVFDPAFDHVIDAVWDSNCGGIAARLQALAGAGGLVQPPRLVLRELLALANCHSKSKTPMPVVRDRERLRAHMQQILGEDLAVMYARYQVARALHRLDHAHQAGQPPSEIAALADALQRAEAALAAADPDGQLAAARRAHLRRHYADVEQEAYQWLVSTDPRVRTLCDDVLDTLRVLRCADALRQRGARLKTSAGYEIFVDQSSAEAIFALRHGTEQLLLTALTVPIAAGEANIAESRLDDDGNLRIAFHRGAFARPEVLQRAAAYAACAVNDIQADVIDSFEPVSGSRGHGLEPASITRIVAIVLEETADDAAFAGLVREQLVALSPQLRDQVHVVPRSQPAPPAAPPTAEDRRYTAAAPLPWSRAKQRAALARIARGGHHLADVSRARAFAHVKLIHLTAGEILVEAGAAARFVYVPLAQGLLVVPLGGYTPFVAPAWQPLGNTGVIRGAQRNATISAIRPLALLVIPQAIYLGMWHRPYQPAELVARLQGAPYDHA